MQICGENMTLTKFIEECVEKHEEVLEREARWKRIRRKQESIGYAYKPINRQFFKDLSPHCKTKLTTERQYCESGWKYYLDYCKCGYEFAWKRY